MRDTLFSPLTHSLAEQVISTFRHAAVRLVTAESLTAGLIAAALADVPGASNVLEGGAVTYSYALKTALLDVPADVLMRDGAVNTVVAAQMARGALDRALKADMAIAVTGEAGPESSGEEPPGSVYLAVALRLPDDPPPQVTRHQFPGGRLDVRIATVEAALRAALEMLPLLVARR
jgi:nicotinamide-nucleotide amidase